jgi:hypothetical protein
MSAMAVRKERSSCARWANLTHSKRKELNKLFCLNRRVFKTYLLKESLDRLWIYG